MKERFEGEAGRRLLVDTLRRNALSHQKEELAEALADALELREYSPKEIVLREGGSDTDIYLIIAGTVAIEVNGQMIAKRKTGTYVGEMALIDPTAPRCASIVVTDQAVLGKISELDFTAIAEKYPIMWRALAVESGERHREYLNASELQGTNKNGPAEQTIRDLLLDLKPAQLYAVFAALIALLTVVATLAYKLGQVPGVPGN